MNLIHKYQEKLTKIQLDAILHAMYQVFVAWDNDKTTEELYQDLLNDEVDYFVLCEEYEYEGGHELDLVLKYANMSLDFLYAYLRAKGKSL